MNTGRTPTPIANAPTAQRPYVNARPWKCVPTCQVWDLCVKTTPSTTATPTASTDAPTRSRQVQEPISSRPRGLVAAATAAATNAPAPRTASSDLMNGASASAATAAATATKRRGAKRASGQPERERRPEIGEGLGDDEPGVGDSGDRRGRDPAGDRRLTGHEEPSEPVRGEERCGHHRCVFVLDRRVGAPRGAEPPGRRDHVRVERRRMRVVQTQLGDAVMGDAARQTRPLELVGEEPRRGVLRRLPGVQDEKHDVGDDERVRGEGPVESRPAAAFGIQAHGRSGARTIRGSTSTSRLTNRHVTSRAAQATTIFSNSSWGASGIVTKTMSGCRRSSSGSSELVLPVTRMPLRRRPRSAGSSSTKPTTRSPGVSRSSRRRLRPVAARADDEYAAIGVVPCDLEPAQHRPLGEARAEDRKRADQEVDDEDAAREVAERPCVRTTMPSATISGDADGDERPEHVA